MYKRQLGNLLGSNLLNSVGVGAVIFFTHGRGRYEAPQDLPLFTIYGMMVVSAVIWHFLKNDSFSKTPSKSRIGRLEAVILLVIYSVLFLQMAVSATG